MFPEGVWIRPELEYVHFIKIQGEAKDQMHEPVTRTDMRERRSLHQQEREQINYELFSSGIEALYTSDRGIYVTNEYTIEEERTTRN